MPDVAGEERFDKGLHRIGERVQAVQRRMVLDLVRKGERCEDLIRLQVADDVLRFCPEPVSQLQTLSRERAREEGRTEGIARDL